jgi:hypothetical protein
MLGRGIYYQYRCCDRLVVQQNGLQAASRPLNQRDRNDRVRPSGACLSASARHTRSLAQGGREKPPHMVISRRNLVRSLALHHGKRAFGA